MREQLPTGFSLEEDQDGDWVLIPPESITIFSVPGEGFLIGHCDKETALADAIEHLSSLGISTRPTGGSNHGE